MQLSSGNSTTLMDAVTEGLFLVEDVFNVNSMQLLVVDDRLAVPRLRRALLTVLPRFPLLLSAPDEQRKAIIPMSWRPGDIPVEERELAGPFGFGDPTFRRTVSDWNTDRPIRWRNVPPVRFGVFQCAGGGAAALAMCVHHSVADAKSDSMLLRELMAQYAAEARSEARERAARRTHRFTALPARVPQGSGPARRITIAIRAMISAAACMGRRDIGYPGGRQTDLRQNRAIDFYCSLVPRETQLLLLASSRSSGYSLNCIIAAAIMRMQARRCPEHDPSKKIRLIAPASLRKRLNASQSTEYRNFMVPCVVRIRDTADDHQFLDDLTRRFDEIKREGIFVELWKQRMLMFLMRSRILQPLALRAVYAGYGSSVVYSNPGIIEESFEYFGLPALRITDYIGVGCMPPPAQMMIYTPMVDGRLHLNAVFLRNAFENFEAEVMDPIWQELERIIQGLR